MPLSIHTICVCGAGTMGSGIAQVAAQSGFATILFDLDGSALEKAAAAIDTNLEFLVGKQKLTAIEKEAIIGRIRFVSSPDDCRAELIIEAIVEKMDSKVWLFRQLAAVNGVQTIFATNTSSLSISSLQENIPHPERVAGMHFFNPAYMMKLVEVVKGKQSSAETMQTIYDLCGVMGKKPVRCEDAPGFIVNRVARPYYLEALRLVEEGVAAFDTVDDIMEASGFKMGPFRLMDLIGMDINLSVTQGVYEAFNRADRFTPSPLQEAKVKKGELGKKTGKGFYDYNPPGKSA